MMKKDISANLYQKCFILCSKILLNVLYNLGLTILFPWQHTGFQTSPILKVFLATLCVQFSYLQMLQAYKYVSLSLWPRITVFELKIKVVVWTVAWPYFRPMKILYVLLLSMNRKCYLRLICILNKILIFFRTFFCFLLLKLGKWTPLLLILFFFCKKQIEFSYFFNCLSWYKMRNNMVKK